MSRNHSHNQVEELRNAKPLPRITTSTQKTKTKIFMVLEDFLTYSNEGRKFTPKVLVALQRWLLVLHEVPPVLHFVELVPDHYAHPVQLDVEGYGGAELLKGSREPCKHRALLGPAEVEVVDWADLVDVAQLRRRVGGST